MSKWRFVGECRQGKNREEIQTESIDGLSPWKQSWTRLNEPDVVMQNPSDNSRWYHLHTYEAEWNGATVKWRGARTDVDSRFWLRRVYVFLSILQGMELKTGVKKHVS